MLIASLLSFSVIAGAAIDITAKLITSANGLTNTGGAIDITVSGGSGSYQYQWSNQMYSEDITNVAAGTYSVTVYDSQQQTATATFKVDYTQEAYDLITKTNVAKCKNFSMDVLTNANSNIKSYLWSDGSTKQFLLAKTAGKYNCIATFSSGMKIIDTVDVADITVTKPTIIGASMAYLNSTSTYSVQNYVTNYSYQYSLQGTKGIITTTPNPTLSINEGTASWGSVSGTENVICTATTKEQCSDTSMLKVTLKQFIAVTPLSVTGIVTDATNATSNDGAIDITVVNGTAPYKYSWSNQATSEDISNIKPGNYSVIVSDNANAYTTVTFIVNNKSDFIPKTTITKCKGSSIDVLTKVNSNIVSYLWSDGTTNSYLLAKTEGTYFCTATLQSGTKLIDSIEVKDQVIVLPSTITGDKVVYTNSNTIYSFQSKAYNIYSWSLGYGKGVLSNPSNYNQTATPATNVAWGSNTGTEYLILEAKSGNCSDTVSFPITIIDANALSIIGTVTTANGLTNTGGAIDITISGGTAPYQIVWNTSAISEDLTNLSSGTYSVTVYDNTQASSSATFTIGNTQEPYDVITKTTISKCKEYSVDVMTNANSNIASFLWSDGSTKQFLLAKTAGKYYCTATFTSGMKAVDSIVVSDIVVTKPTIIGNTMPYVNSSSTYSIYNYVTNYSYKYSLQGTKGIITTAPNPTVSINDGSASWGSASGTEYVICIATTKEQCSDTAKLEVTLQDNIVVEPPYIHVTGIVTDASNATSNNGAIDITVVNGTAPYKYSWSNQATSEDVSNLKPGNYSVFISDNANAYTTATFTIEDKSDFITETSITKCKGSSIDVLTKANSNIVSYLWSDGTTKNYLLAKTVGKYFCTATLQSGTKLIDSVEVKDQVIVLPNAIIGDKVVYTNSNNSYYCQSAEYNSELFTWSLGYGKGVLSNPNNYNQTATPTANVAWGSNTGTEYLILEAKSGKCSDTISFPITIIDGKALSVIGTVTHANGITNTGGSINITTNGGIPAYTYAWNNMQISEDLTNLAAGTYTVTVYDSKQNQTTESFTVGFTKETIDIIANNTQYTCEGYSTDIMATQNANIASYKWNDSSTKPYVLAKNPGMYYVSATFKSGMIVTDSIELIVDKITAAQIDGNTTIEIDNKQQYEIGNVNSNYNYSWAIQNKNIAELNLSNTSSIVSLKGIVAGKTELYVISHLNQCSRVDTAFITVIPKSDSLSVSGTVKGGTTANNEGTVELYISNDTINAVKTVVINPNGYFEFKNLKAGDYYLKAKPNTTLSKDYKNTVYVKSSFFSTANALTVDGDIFGLDIALLTGSVTGVDIVENEISLYPNPATSSIHIDAGTDMIDRITIYTIDGTEILQSTEKAINISQLNNGVYKVVIISKSATKAYLFIKQ